MSKCKQCNIEILDETERCPLCKAVLEKTIEVENMYPNVRMTTRRLMLISHIYLFCAIIVEALLVYVNVAYEFQIFWSAISGLALFYGYMLLRYAILGKSGYQSKRLGSQLRAAVRNSFDRCGDSGAYDRQSQKLAELYDAAAFHDSVQRTDAFVLCDGMGCDEAAACRRCIRMFCGVVSRNADYRRQEGADGA